MKSGAKAGSKNVTAPVEGDQPGAVWTGRPGRSGWPAANQLKWPIRADTEQLRTATRALGEPGAMDRVRHVHELLTCEVWPHEQAEESSLYPALNRVLGGTDPTAPMSRGHAEIAVQIARLGRLIDDIGDRDPDEADIADLRDILYGLHAVLQLHTVQEDETYLSLGDAASAGHAARDQRPGGGLPILALAGTPCLAGIGAARGPWAESQGTSADKHK